MFAVILVIGAMNACVGDEVAAARTPVVVPSGVTASVQPVMRRLPLSAKPAAKVTKSPDAAVTGWTVMPFGTKDKLTSVHIAIAEAEGTPPRVWLDANGNGDLTDDGPVTVDSSKFDGQGKGYFTFDALLPQSTLSESPLHLLFIRYGAKDAERRRLPQDVLFCTPDYGMSYQLEVGGKKFAMLLTDDAARGDFTYPMDEDELSAWVDVNGNTKFEKGERFGADRAIEVGGTSLIILSVSANGRDIKFVAADSIKRVALGEPEGKARGFTGKSLKGGDIKFPDAYKGKVVLLDFWATWCGPCVGEIPHVLDAYGKFHEKGFDVLGVSLDRPGTKKLLADFVKDRKMKWEQVFPGTGIATDWSVDSIPRMYLIDGDTGEILVSGGSLRGEGLEPAIEAALKKKFGAKGADK